MFTLKLHRHSSGLCCVRVWIRKERREIHRDIKRGNKRERELHVGKRDDDS